MNKHWLEADWPAPANVYAYTTLRSGGVSGDQFSSLNLARHVGDIEEHVAENRKRIAAMLKLPAEPVWMEQVHGNNVVRADKVVSVEKADASFTDAQGVVCAVLTADCLPIVLCDWKGAVVAAVHAGWRGLLAGVLENTVLAMRQEKLLAWLGPAIGAECFQVGGEVRDAFITKAPVFSAAFKSQKTDKWLADMYRIARIILSKIGVNQVYGGGLCTMTESGRFYSYRRDGETGRMATLIWRE